MHIYIYRHMCVCPYMTYAAYACKSLFSHICNRFPPRRRSALEAVRRCVHPHQSRPNHFAHLGIGSVEVKKWLGMMMNYVVLRWTVNWKLAHFHPSSTWETWVEIMVEYVESSQRLWTSQPRLPRPAATNCVSAASFPLQEVVLAWENHGALVPITITLSVAQ